jgi:hypothetical protein
VLRMDKQRLQGLRAQADECDRLVLRINGHHPERGRRPCGLPATGIRASH